MNMSKAKMIEVGGGLSVKFLQRARGEESPFWVGEILLNGVRIGTFNNEGRGGMTFIRPIRSEISKDFVDVESALRGLVDACPGGSSIQYEREAIVITYAEIKGYNKRAKDITLADVVAEYARELGTVG